MTEFRIPDPDELYEARGHSCYDRVTLRDTHAAHIVIDLETLGLSHDAAIISIGGVALDTAYEPVSYFASGPISMRSNDTCGRTVDASTVAWWLDQPAEVRKFSFMTTVDDGFSGAYLSSALRDFFIWGDFEHAKKKVWGNGPEFDNVILAAAWERTAAKSEIWSWPYYNNQSIRTIRLIAEQLKLDVMEREPLIQHVALYDAYAEALYLRDVMGKLREIRNKE